MELYPTDDGAFSATNVKSIDQFFADAASGHLPSFSLLDPNYNTQSQENPSDMVRFEAFLAQAVHALGSSPGWRQTMLIVTYDEHGGYYDHIAPPAALAPDSVGPMVQPGESTYDGYARYGFRVPRSSSARTPSVTMSATSSTTTPRSWPSWSASGTWPAMTYRDANANNLTDFLDLGAMEARQPTFPELPPLAAAGMNAATLACEKTGPGRIPPAEAQAALPRPLPRIRVELRDLGVHHGHLRGLLLELRTSHGTLTGLEIELHHDRHRVARHSLHRLAHAERRVVLRVHGRAPRPGRYAVVVGHGHRTLLRRVIRVR
jgi:phospholipase C